MTRWSVDVTNTAYEDLREAAAYMRDSLKSPGAAADFVAAFEAQVEALKTFPEGRPPARDHELARKGYRWCPVGKFMVFYTTDRATLRVIIERVLYGSRDWKSLV
jgi:toxin ParE1/3/4